MISFKAFENSPGFYINRIYSTKNQANNRYVLISMGWFIFPAAKS
jgi:hypothetical protein